MGTSVNEQRVGRTHLARPLSLWERAGMRRCQGYLLFSLTWASEES
jgi:hypothetical protein